MTPEAAQSRVWDVIVIGTGMGGGLAGRRLAERGLSVLYVEKGRTGHRSEEQSLSGKESPDARILRGAWPKPVIAKVDGVEREFFAGIGCAVGGTSVFYAAALERPERHDLESVPGLEHPTGGWPGGYDAFSPYFDEAQKLLKVAGTPDPLASEPTSELQPPPEMSPGETALFEELRGKGLHPYYAQHGLRHLDGCLNCAGHKCPRPCKMDGRSAGIEPALATGRAHLLADCSVEELIEDSGRIAGIRARTGWGEITLRAQTYILAAGALGSPRLLLASRGTHSEGCANSSGWVGRGLMFHIDELFVYRPRRARVLAGPTRAIALRDFYTHAGQRLGLVQSMLVPANAGRIAVFLKGIYDQSAFRRFSALKRLAIVPAIIGERLFSTSTIFVGLVEDLGYFENRVALHPEDPDIPIIEYTITPELKARRKLFQKTVRKALGRWRVLMIRFLPELNFGHPCGTLRFGTDPSTSVLDPDCKAHDLKNLYVADASFMPTSMGVNPSLSIAANALRVADIIAMRAEARTMTKEAC